MSEFWYAMAPWLMMAVFVPVCALLCVKMFPYEEWCQKVILEWADFEGLKVVAVDDFCWFDRFFPSGQYRVFRVRVWDQKGCERECKAVVGRFLIWPTYRNIKIKWIKAG